MSKPILAGALFFAAGAAQAQMSAAAGGGAARPRRRAALPGDRGRRAYRRQPVRADRDRNAQREEKLDRPLCRPAPAAAARRALDAGQLRRHRRLRRRLGLHLAGGSRRQPRVLEGDHRQRWLSHAGRGLRRGRVRLRHALQRALRRARRPVLAGDALPGPIAGCRHRPAVACLGGGGAVARAARLCQRAGRGRSSIAVVRRKIGPR